MKKTIFSIAFLLTTAAFAQQTIIVNGGIFGSSAENISVNVYDTQTQSLTNIDSIGSQSVQDILIDGTNAFIAAQDSLVKYDLSSQQRSAGIKFQGVSCRTMGMAANNELVVANWYGRTAYNIYIYNANTLALVDSIDVQAGIKGMLIEGDNLYLSHNSSTGAPNYQDTLGYIIRASIANRSVLDTIRVSGYSGDFGLFQRKADGTAFYAFNSVSNTVSTIAFPSSSASPINTVLATDIKIGSQSQFSIFGDTLFLKMDKGIGAIDLNNLNVLDTNIIDTVVTAFTFDTLNRTFYVTQTDFFSYTKGKVYDRNGSLLRAVPTASSPEVIRMYYDQSTGIFEFNGERASIFSLYPNPASQVINLELKEQVQANSELYIQNLNGQSVKEFSNLTNISSFSVEDLTQGIYFVTLVSGSELFTEKLIIE